MKEEKDLFLPYIAGYLGKSMKDAQQCRAKLEDFDSTAKVKNMKLALVPGLWEDGSTCSV